jgi:inhibitor of KinA
MRVLPLGDQAALVYLANELTASQFAAAVGKQSFSWLIDVVQSYSSVAVFFDLATISFVQVAERLQALEAKGVQAVAEQGRRFHHIPCCYEYQLDMERVAAKTGLTSDEIIALHLGPVYTVFAIGFCPGFPYLGYLPPELAAIPRLPAPRLRVESGSVGMTGRQTGIYTESRPGGWNIIGRTPLELVHVADGYFPLRTGERVQFQRIDEVEYRRLQGQRL